MRAQALGHVLLPSHERPLGRSERARVRRCVPPQGKDSASISIFEDLKANPETEWLLNQVVHPNERVREQAIKGLMRLARDISKQRDLIEVLAPYMEL